MFHVARPYTGATFRRAEAAEVPAPQRPAIAAYTPHLNGTSGVTVGEYEVRVPDMGDNR